MTQAHLVRKEAALQDALHGLVLPRDLVQVMEQTLLNPRLLVYKMRHVAVRMLLGQVTLLCTLRLAATPQQEKRSRMQEGRKKKEKETGLKQTHPLRKLGPSRSL